MPNPILPRFSQAEASGERRVPQDDLGLPGSELQSVGKASGGFHHRGAEKRRAKFQAMGHTAAVGLGKEVFEQVRSKVEVENPRRRRRLARPL
jgi:hypothetical protein